MGVTMDDVARRAGVSRAAVSMALRNSTKISPDTRDAIRQAASELGYRPNANASQLARARSSTIGVLVSDLRVAVNADILEGFAPEDPDWSDQLYLASGFSSPDRERTAIDRLRSRQVAALVLIGPGLPPEEIQHLAQQGPLVVVGRTIPGVDCVLVDDAEGARLATQHLIDLGHQRIAHIDGGEGSGAERRRNAYLKAMKAAGPSPEVVHGDYTEASGYVAARRLLESEHRPTAIFGANDLTALGALGAARDLGLGVPEDLSVAGFDDISITQAAYICMTTVSYPRRELGEVARRIVEDRMSGDFPAGSAPRTIQLEPSLAIRRTTAAPKSG